MARADKSVWRMVSLAILVGSILSAAAIADNKSNNEDAQDAYRDAQNFRRVSDTRSAKIALLNAAEDDPKWSAVPILQAELALDLLDPVAARTMLDRAISLGADQRQLNHLYGHAFWLEGDAERAIAVLESEDIAEPYQAYANRILGRVYLDRGNFDAAESAMDAALKLAPKDSLLWTDIARFRLNSGNQRGAIEAADRAVELDNNNVRALEFRGRMTRTQFGLLAAIPWFERGLAVNPNDIPLLEEYAVTLGEVGRMRDMLLQARRILALDRHNGRAFYMQAVIAVRAGEYELAQRILNRAGPNITETPGVMMIAGVSEYELGNYNRAIDIFDRLVAQQPRNFEIRKLLARSLLRAGRSLDALDQIKSIAARDDADSYSLRLAARAFEASGDRSRAAAGLDEAAKPLIRSMLPIPEPMSLDAAKAAALRSPNDARAIIPLIRVYMQTGRLGDAALEAAKLANTNPGVPDAHILVGDVESARGNLTAAIKAYQNARVISFTEPTMLRLVRTYRQAGRFGDAADVLQAFLVLNPSSLNVLRLQAYLYLDNSQWAQAVPVLERLRDRIGYNDSILLANLARGYSGVLRHADAAATAKLAYNLDPANVMVTKIYGQVLLRSGKRLKSARELLEKTAILSPTDADVKRDLAKLKVGAAKTKPSHRTKPKQSKKIKAS